jgi:hypothetical protein
MNSMRNRGRGSTTRFLIGHDGEIRIAAWC